MVQSTKKQQSGPPQKKAAYAYPSRFGSHRSMVQAESGDESVPSGRKCVCIDEHGSYVTEMSRLDNGLADPARYATSRLKKLFARSL